MTLNFNAYKYYTDLNNVNDVIGSFMETLINSKFFDYLRWYQHK